MMGSIKNWFVKTTNDLTPAEIPKQSVFLSDGRLTPIEFTQAGDRLILASKMWEWKSASGKGKSEPTLDSSKQFLKGKTISKARLSDENPEATGIKIIEDGWQEVGGPDIKKPENFEESTKNLEPVKEVKTMNFEDDDDEPEIYQQAPNSEEAKKQQIVNDQMRLYEVHITYDRHYLTPRFWLSGVDSKNVPLTKEQIMEEVMNEYREKTVTYDIQPHTGEYMVNIHPCKHANVLKNFAEQAESHGNKVKPDQSLFLFLKFIGSVMPAVEVDFTVEMEL